MIEPFYVIISGTAVLCLCAGVLIERWKLTKRFRNLLSHGFDGEEWPEASFRGLILGLEVFKGLKPYRDVHRTLKLCESGRWKTALASIERVPSVGRSVVLASLRLRLVIHLGQWSSLEPSIKAVLNTNGSPRLILASLVASQQWQRALSFYDLRLKRQGSQLERDWLLWLSNHSKDITSQGTLAPSVDLAKASFAEILKARLPEDELLEHVRVALDAGVRCLDEARSFIEFREKIKHCESQEQCLHLIEDIEVRSDWWGLKLAVHRAVYEGRDPAIMSLLAEMKARSSSARGYRCGECDWVSSFGWLCPSCNRVGLGWPSREEPNAAGVFEVSLTVFGGVDTLEPLYWSTLLKHSVSSPREGGTPDVVLEAT